MIKGYRTYVVAAVVAAFGALAALDWNPILDDPKAGGWLIVAAIAQAVLRSVTSTPPGKGSLYSQAWLGVALALALTLGGCAGVDTLSASGPGETMVRIGKAIYAVECKTSLPGLIGAGVVAIASVRAPDGVAATTARSAVQANAALIAAACPAARAVELALSPDL